MKTILAACSVLVAAIPCKSQLILNQGDTLAFPFQDLQLVDPALFSSAGDYGLVVFTVVGGTFQTGERLRYEMFENSINEPPLVSAVLDTVPPGVGKLDIDVSAQVPGWGDLQGVVRLTMLSGSAAIGTLGVHRYVPVDSRGSHDYWVETRFLSDTDGDGVYDAFDQCPGTAAGAVVDTNGCSIAQLVPCDGPRTEGQWKNHGHYVSQVSKTVRAFLEAGLTTAEEARILVQAAASSNCGRADDVPRYQIRDLGVLPGTVLSDACCINNRGDVAGDLEDDDDINTPFLFRQGRMIPLGLPPGPYTDGHARDINEQGVVVGINRGQTDFDAAFLYADGQLYGLSNVLQYPIVNRVGINNRGTLVGSGQFEERGQYFAFVYQNGVRTMLPSLIPGGNVIAEDINDAGQVIGLAQALSSNPTEGISYHAVIYSHEALIDLGTLPGGKFSQGARINEAGHAIGSSQTSTPGSSHAFLYRDGFMIDLGALPGDVASTANGINNKDEVVGSSIAEGSHFRAALFLDGRVYDLNTLLNSRTDLFLEQATGINDEGVIVGTARLGPYPRAAVLTPVKRSH